MCFHAIFRIFFILKVTKFYFWPPDPFNFQKAEEEWFPIKKPNKYMSINVNCKAL